MTHTDIKSEGWIAQLPPPLQPYALLARLDRPVGVWLLLLPGWWGIVLAMRHIAQFSWIDFETFILFAAGAVVMRAAGCIINDLWDRDLDRQVERTRDAAPRRGNGHAATGRGVFGRPCCCQVSGFCARCRW